MFVVSHMSEVKAYRLRDFSIFLQTTKSTYLHAGQGHMRPSYNQLSVRSVVKHLGKNVSGQAWQNHERLLTDQC